VSHEFSTLARLNELASEKYEELGETVVGLGVFADSLRRKDENVSPLFDDLDAVELNLTVLEGTADTLEQEADRLELRAKEVRALIAAKKT
jgi:ABC-type transporter Mla subunit MlaD